MNSISRKITMLIIIILLLALNQSCIRITTTGQPSGTIKKQVVNSWLFKSTDIFYPTGTILKSVDDYPILDKKEVAKLDLGMKDIVKLLTAIHAKWGDNLDSHFGQHFTRDIRATVIIVNEGRPIARSLVNGKKNLEIYIDVKVLQANFRGSLVNSIKGDSGFGASGLQGKTDKELIESFIRLKDEIKKAPAGNRVGDLITVIKSGDDFDNSRWFRMVNFMERANQLQSRYYGTLMFLLAHEMGHYVFGHHNLPCPAAQCDTFKKEEIDADKYASVLLANFLSGFGPFGNDPFFAFANYSGFSAYFEHSYERIGFVSAEKAKCNCEYPSKEERLHAAKEAFETSYGKNMEKLSEEYIKAIDEAFKKMSDPTNTKGKPKK